MSRLAPSEATVAVDAPSRFPVLPGDRGVASPHERRFAALVGTRHAIGFGFARTAIAAAVRLAGRDPGGEVVVSGLTCRVVPLAIRRAGLRPRFADIAADILNLDPAAVGRALSPATRAVLFQHTYGQAAGLDLVSREAGARGIPLIEDRAQTLPAPGAPLVGLAAVYSNNLLKPLPAGSGAMLVTEDDGFATAVRAARDELPEPGLGARALAALERRVHRWLTPERYWLAYDLHRRLAARKPEDLASLLEREIAAAERRAAPSQERVGDRWLQSAAELGRRRIAAVAAYRRSLPDLGLSGIEDGALYYYPILAADKPGLLAEARRRRLEIVAWPIERPIYPIETASGLHDVGYEPGQCPVAERVAARLVGLPTRLGDRPAIIEPVARLVRDLVSSTSRPS